jgi:hypothetical protein
MKDLTGREMTASERRILRAYRSLEALREEPDLPPTVVAGIEEAIASLWQVVNNLALRYERPDDVRR